MADLVVPSPDDLATFMRDDTTDEDVAVLFLLQGADLFFLATDLSEEPEDAREVRLKNNAIMSMAQYLLVTSGKLGAAYSPFLKENMGSYSYEKLMNVQQGTATGVLWFDASVKYFSSRDFPLSSGTTVFEFDDSMLYEINNKTHVLGPLDKSRFNLSDGQAVQVQDK